MLVSPNKVSFLLEHKVKYLFPVMEMVYQVNYWSFCQFFKIFFLLKVSQQFGNSSLKRRQQNILCYHYIITFQNLNLSPVDVFTYLNTKEQWQISHPFRRPPTATLLYFTFSWVETLLTILLTKAINYTSLPGFKKYTHDHVYDSLWLLGI